MLQSEHILEVGLFDSTDMLDAHQPFNERLHDDRVIYKVEIMIK